MKNNKDTSKSIRLPDETFQALSLIAERKGKTVEEYVREMIETEILAAKPFDDILAPIRQGFAERGMSADEITAMFEKARDEVHKG